LVAAHQFPPQFLNKKNTNFKGYSPLLSSNNNSENPSDLQEGFGFGYELLNYLNTSEQRDDGVMAGANIWPSALPSFCEAALKY
jgi:isopenicillin N synthase-like dioxygenase